MINLKMKQSKLSNLKRGLKVLTYRFVNFSVYNIFQRLLSLSAQIYQELNRDSRYVSQNLEPSRSLK